jgi:UDP-N-acetylmuramate--alanine ligase
VLAAFKEQFPQRKLTVLFQPHRYSRTEACWKDFVNCFGDADRICLLDIYAAGEKPINGITSKKLTEEIRHSNRSYFESKDAAKDDISKNLKSGDIFLTLGAGDVWRVGEEIYLRAKS